MKRLVAGAAVISLAAMLAGCDLPHRKDLDELTKLAATPSTAASVVLAYDDVRARADARWSASALASAEGGPLLRIDAGAYLVSFRLAPDQPLETTRLDSPVAVASPRFARYPLWFVAEVPVPAEGVSRVPLFKRGSTTAPWRMLYGPEIAGDATLPEFRTDEHGAAIPVSPQDGDGVVASPERACRDYAKVLQTRSTPLSREFANDTFRRQMRAIQDSQARLAYTTFRQHWSARPVRYALRLDDGGVLAFATLVRTDHYLVQPGGYLRWHGNADARAYLPHGVSHWARLRYYHQILMEIPPDGGGKPAVIGQYGGVVSAAGS
jgi:hypothetical protein